MTSCFSRMEHQQTICTTLSHSCTPIVLEFTELENCPPNLHPVDYSMWNVATDGISSQISDTDRLKHMLIDCCTQLSQDTLNQAINQLPKDWWSLSWQVFPCWISSELILCANGRCSYFHLVHLVNADSAPSGRQHSDKPTDLGCESTVRLLPSTSTVVILLLLIPKANTHFTFMSLNCTTTVHHVPQYLLCIHPICYSCIVMNISLVTCDQPL